MGKTYDRMPEMQLKKDASYSAVLHTSEGDIEIGLLADKSPLTTNNFVALARDGYFDGVIFHRIVRGFVIQGGDPQGTGMGGPGYSFADELPPVLPYAPGVVAMANAGPNTNGSQFFICTGAHSSGLNSHPNYSVFGQVTSGMETVMKIDGAPVAMAPGGEMSRPKEEIRITSIEIKETPAAP